jgi:hypothetical protein
MILKTHLSSDKTREIQTLDELRAQVRMALREQYHVADDGSADASIIQSYEARFEDTLNRLCPADRAAA